MKILHCITGLSPDGAQQMLLRLSKQLVSEGHETMIVSLSSQEAFASEFEKLGIRVEFLGMNKGVPSLSAIVRLIQSIRSFKPNIVQAWMYHANLYSIIACLFCPGSLLVWNIRRSLYEYAQLKLHTRLTIRLCAALSRFVKACIYCTDSSQSQHARIGFRPKQSLVIGNGFDLDLIKPNHTGAEKLRSLTSIPAEAHCIGIVGRFDVAKDFPNFFAAAALVLQKFPATHFVCIGRGLENDNPTLSTLLQDFPHPDHLHLLGQQPAAHTLMSGFTVYCSSARSEGFPNTIAEALASGVPCAVTDVGASRTIVSNFGRVVPPEDSTALAHALIELLSLPAEERKALGAAGRESMQKRFSITACCTQYLYFYADCLRLSPDQLKGSVNVYR